uniref:Uncharacterized protein n=1 Tax=candidate division WOR-3 bacterium TaxID=2052148 RepID=A0A7C6A7V6_UNCW3
MILIFGFIFFNIGFAQMPNLEIEPKNRTIDISVIKRVTQQYYLLTKESPIELSIVGPNWLRVYTRLLFPQAIEQKNAKYKIVVSEEEEERIVSLETEKSNSAIGPANQKFGKWRSFFIEVPAGTNKYKFSLWQAPSDTVAVRFSLEKPKEWQPISVGEAISSRRRIIIEEAGKTLDGYELTSDEPIKLELSGPLRLKVGVRLNYDLSGIGGIEGAQKFAIVVKENGKEMQKAQFRVNKSETAKYQNRPELIPSVERFFYLAIPEGKHQIIFELTETIAKSANLRFLSKSQEKYE